MSDAVPEPGAKVWVRGVVEGHYQGGAVVQFPTATGGTIGVPTELEGVKLGELVRMEGTVRENTRGVLTVAFPLPGGGEQLAELAQLRVEIKEGSA